MNRGENCHGCRAPLRAPYDPAPECGVCGWLHPESRRELPWIGYAFSNTWYEQERRAKIRSPIDLHDFRTAVEGDAGVILAHCAFPDRNGVWRRIVWQRWSDIEIGRIALASDDTEVNAWGKG